MHGSPGMLLWWNTMKYGLVVVILAYTDIQDWKISLFVGNVNVRVAFNRWKYCHCNPAIERISKCKQCQYCDDMDYVRRWSMGRVLTDCPAAVSKDALMIVMKLLHRANQYGSSLSQGLLKSVASCSWQNRNCPLMCCWLCRWPRNTPQHPCVRLVPHPINHYNQQIIVVNSYNFTFVLIDWRIVA